MPVELPVMRRLWIRMAEIYGHRWTSAYGDDAGGSAGQTWAKGLAGLTPRQIGHGLDVAIASPDDWPPSLPAFRAMCFDIPDIAVVRAQLADRGPALSRFARLVWQHIDAHRYRRADAATADRLLREAYGTARDHVMRGGELPPEPAGEIAPPVEPERVVTPEVARAHLDALRKQLYGRGADEALAS